MNNKQTPLINWLMIAILGLSVANAPSTHGHTENNPDGTLEVAQLVKTLGDKKHDVSHDLDSLAAHQHLAVRLLVDQLHQIPHRTYWPKTVPADCLHVVTCLRALRFLTGEALTNTSASKLTDDERQFLDFKTQMHDENPEHQLHFFGVWMSRDAIFVAPQDAQRAIIEKWHEWIKAHGDDFQYTPKKSASVTFDDWYWYG